MNIGFIGAGKVGFSLGRYLKENGYTLSGYYSHSEASAEDAARFTDSNRYVTMKQLAEVTDLLFLTVPDGQIAPVWNEMKDWNLKGKIICHCSGALSSQVFSGMEETGAYGFSVHPFLAISDKYRSYQDMNTTFFTIEGSHEKLQEIADLLGHCGNQVQVIRAEDKVKYHAAASIVSNFAVTLTDMAKDMLLECGFDEDHVFDALGPIMRANTNSMIEKGTVNALTGPVERADLETVEKHLSVLNDDDKVLYKALAGRTVKVAKKKHPDRDYSGLREVLK